MISDISEYYHEIKNENDIVSFLGVVTPDSLSVIMQNIEIDLERMQEQPRICRKIYTVLIECLQNLYHHTDELEIDEHRKSPSSICLVNKHNEGYTITTSNYIQNEKIEKFKSHLDNINQLSKESLKEYYKEVLNNGQKSTKDGAGLGMIDISRKTDDKLNFNFVPLLDGNYSLFVLNIKILK